MADGVAGASAKASYTIRGLHFIFRSVLRKHREFLSRGMMWCISSLRKLTLSSVGAGLVRAWQSQD